MWLLLTVVLDGPDSSVTRMDVSEVPPPFATACPASPASQLCHNFCQFPSLREAALSEDRPLFAGILDILDKRGVASPRSLPAASCST